MGLAPWQTLPAVTFSQTHIIEILSSLKTLGNFIIDSDWDRLLSLNIYEMDKNDTKFSNTQYYINIRFGM